MPHMSQPIYNSRIIDTFLRLIKARYHSVNVDLLLKSAGIKAYEIEDQGYWLTQEQVDRFHEKLVQLTGNEQIAREAGRYAAAPDALGSMRYYILGLAGPARAFELINKSALILTRSSKYESRAISDHCVEIVVTPHEGMSEKPFQCENRAGFFEAILLMFDLKSPHIEHPECMFKGSTTCRYIITWKNSISLTLKRIGAGATLLFVTTSLFLSVWGQWELLKNLSHFFVPAALLLAAFIQKIEKNELRTRLNDTIESTDKLTEQIDTNYNNSQMINEVGQVLNYCSNSDDILEQVITIIKNRLNYDRGIVFFVNTEENRPILRADYGYTPEHHELLDTLSFQLELSGSKSEGVRSLLEDHNPLLINDIHANHDGFSIQLSDFFTRTGTQSAICCPIVSEGKSIGLLMVDNVTQKRKLMASDVSLLMGIASVIGVSLRNAELVEEKVLYERERLKNERLESLGVLAGGIAHDFNNILSIVTGNISFAQTFLDTAHKSYNPLIEADKACVRAGELAHQLLTFARGGEPVKKVVSLQQIVYEAVSLALHGSNVKGSIDLPDSLHDIEADEGQLSQVFHNLIINATQAMPEGGKFTVAAQNVALTSHNTQALPEGLYVKLTFSDHGCGISEDDLKKIFDPYFTTKSTGNGLGLASVFSIINRHGGHIGVASEVGKGTTFTIHLPATSEAGSECQAQSDTQTVEVHTGGSILIMDDEEMIRNMMTELLSHLGYQVTTCENGTEAITMYKSASDQGTPFSMVIMDLTIPGGMGGKEAAQQILNIDPKACLIVSSGYSNDPIISDIRSYGFSGVITKPFKLMELEQLISSVLAAK